MKKAASVTAPANRLAVFEPMTLPLASQDFLFARHYRISRRVPQGSVERGLSAEEIHRKARPPHHGVARLLRDAHDARPVDADQAATPFARLAGNEHGVDVAGV